MHYIYNALKVQEGVLIILHSFDVIPFRFVSVLYMVTSFPEQMREWTQAYHMYYVEIHNVLKAKASQGFICYGCLFKLSASMKLNTLYLDQTLAMGGHQYY